MSTAKLNVWITALGDACHIGDKYTWYVHITDCHGKVLEWCGRKFTYLDTKCGHAEIEIPPGCYTVFASMGPGIPPFGNQLTHVQVVRANCGDHVCVTLYAPTGHYCATWFASALHVMAPMFEQAKIDPNLAKATQAAVENFIAKIEPDPYAVNVQRLIAEGPPKK
jgi:hypothetical protein